ncbi:S-adenosyl-L-methionine-dependent methyltransferase [Ramaria rubella]|nr:S-adenosyl-L-methionine-dependent methyltransferase [Ramaria rubella]
MATFSKKTFNAVTYSAIRPTYPRALYDFVYHYHERTPGARWDRAVDLGCGTGQATTELTAFQEVIGVDPSESMVRKAEDLVVNSPLSNKVSYVQHAAEDLDFLESGSVDLIVAAQAAHWFDYSKLWPQLSRVLRKNGSVAFWGYSQFRIAGCPSLTPLIHDYSLGKDPNNSLGLYWEQPGRSILDNHFLDVPKAPEPDFKDHEHIFWTGDYYPAISSPRPTLLRKGVSWEGFQAYLRTFSALYAFHEKHPEDASKRTGLAHRPSDGKGGDIVERFWWRLKDEIAKHNGGDEGEEVDIEWPMAMLLFKRS